MKENKFIILFTTFITSILCGCSAWNQSPSQAIVRNNGRSIVPVTELAKTPEYADLHFYAALSANVYIDDKSKTTTSWDEFCKNDGIQYVPEGWSLYTPNLNIPKPSLKYKLKGMEYQVWVKKSKGLPTLVVIVFRGTDAKEVGDWLSNFRWVTRFIPFLWDQYDQAQKLIPDLVKNIQENCGKDAVIIAAGHSLGGGLAQQAAYKSEYIRTVYAFDPSSVTGYYDIDKDAREKNEKGLTIYRVYEHGEILSYLRLLMKGLYPLSRKDPEIVEIRYNLVKGNTVSQHSIKDFACGLHNVAESVANH